MLIQGRKERREWASGDVSKQNVSIVQKRIFLTTGQKIWIKLFILWAQNTPDTFQENSTCCAGWYISEIANCPDLNEKQAAENISIRRWTPSPDCLVAHQSIREPKSKEVVRTLRQPKTENRPTNKKHQLHYKAATFEDSLQGQQFSNFHQSIPY